jgi:hypothetical protein
MADHRLLKQQKDELFKIFLQKNIDPTNFEWEDAESNLGNKISILSHIQEEHFFLLDRRPENHPESDRGESWAIRFSPCFDRKEQGLSVLNWKAICKHHFPNWCDWLIPELGPDLWELAKQNKLIIASENQDGKKIKFSKQEQESISQALYEIKVFIVTNNELTDGQILSLNEKMEMLENESKRMNKEPWLHTLVGVLFGIATNATFAPERAHQLFDFAYNCLRQVLESPLLLK